MPPIRRSCQRARPRSVLNLRASPPSVLNLVIDYFDSNEDDHILSVIVSIRRSCNGTYHFLKQVLHNNSDIHLMEANGRCVRCKGRIVMSNDFVIYSYYYSFENKSEYGVYTNTFIKEETIRVRKWDCLACSMYMWESKQARRKEPVVIRSRQRDMKFMSQGTYFGTAYQDLFATLTIEREESSVNDGIWSDKDGLEQKIKLIRERACTKAAAAIVQSLHAGRKFVEIHGVCGLGKTSRIPLELSSMIDQAVIIVCEPRKCICVAEYQWLRQFFPDFDINLCVGTETNGERIVNNTPTEVLVQKMMGKGGAAKSSIWYTTVGKLEQACSSVICKSKGHSIPNLRVIIAIFSDWEERFDHYGYAIHRMNEMLTLCKSHYVVCFASNAELSGVWKKIFMAGADEDELTTLHLPDKTDLVQGGLNGDIPRSDMDSSNFSSFTYTLHTPDRDNLYYLSIWENYIFNLVANLSPSLLFVNGTILVKALSIETVLRLSKRFEDWQDMHLFEPMDKIKVLSICSRIPTPSLTSTRAIYVCTDQSMLGLSFIKCRALFTSGLQFRKRYDKAFGTACLIPMLATRSYELNVFGRLNREWDSPGFAVSLTPWECQNRLNEDVIPISTDADKYIWLMLNRTWSLTDDTMSSSTSDLARIIAIENNSYAFKLFKLNYGLLKDGEYVTERQKDYTKLMSERMKHGYSRWVFFAMFLYNCLLDDNPKNLTNRAVFSQPKFINVLLKLLLWDSFVEKLYQVVLTKAECEYYDQFEDGFVHRAILKKQFHDFKREGNPNYLPNFGKYSGPGFIYLRWFFKQMDLEPIEYNKKVKLTARWFLKRISHRKYLNRTINLIKFTLGNIMHENNLHRLIWKDVLRLHSNVRLRHLTECELFQAALCVTKPLQIIKLPPENRAGNVTNMVGRNILANKPVDIEVGNTLRWREKTGHLLCHCNLPLKKLSRYAYAPIIKRSKKYKVNESILQASLSIPISHEIAHLCEKNILLENHSKADFNTISQDITVMDNETYGVNALLIETDTMEIAYPD